MKWMFSREHPFRVDEMDVQAANNPFRVMKQMFSREHRFSCR